jgi:hypothetical protein
MNTHGVDAFMKDQHTRTIAQFLQRLLEHLTKVRFDFNILKLFFFKVCADGGARILTTELRALDLLTFSSPQCLRSVVVGNFGLCIIFFKFL